jgi:hypothetical protein
METIIRELRDANFVHSLTGERKHVVRFQRVRLTHKVDKDDPITHRNDRLCQCRPFAEDIDEHVPSIPRSRLADEI